MPALAPSLSATEWAVSTPTVTWFFNWRKVEDDYSTELGKDESLVATRVCGAEVCWHLHLHCQQQSGQCGGICTKLVVCTDDEECTSAPRVESNPDNFGEYVSTFHAYSNSAFFEQFQVI